MDNYSIIQNKLEQFIRKYYTNELIKGTILFFAIGFLYLLFTLFIEHVLWLNPLARTILFFVFLSVEFILLFKFILVPIAKLFKLQRRINYEDASRIIGQFFPEVNDKLLNVLQLKNRSEQSELLLASIEQKANTLKPVPFKLAINFKKNMAYLKYAAIPVLILLITFLTDNLNWFNTSYDRVVHFKTSFEPPAPFRFVIENEHLNAIEDHAFNLVVKAEGDVIPEQVQIEYNDEVYYLKQKDIGVFEYVFTQPKTNIDFKLTANDVSSKDYTLHIVEVPTLLQFEMVLDYPDYTKKQDEILKSTGNAIVPEGTNIIWQLKTKATDAVHLYTTDSIPFHLEESGLFKASKRVYNTLDYSLSISNKKLMDYENLAFRLDVVKDEYPEINVEMKIDSLDVQTLYFHGKVSDDYGFTKLQVVYYPEGDENRKKYEQIAISNSNISDFITAFPNHLDIESGVPYELYFQVFDNDRVNKFKSSKSAVFSYRKRTQKEELEKRLKDQGENIKDLNKSIEKFEEQEKVLKTFTEAQKEKTKLSFNDKKKLQAFIERQKQQDQMMKNFNKRLKDNLEHFEKENKMDDQFKEDLKKRLDENEEQLKRDEKLLKELEKLQEKIDNEDLIEKFEELGKQNKNKKRSLQQLLELTKRFYVQKKLDKLQNDLMKMAENQEKLSNESKENNTKEAQEKLNEEFKSFQEQLEELKKDSKALRKPIDIPQDKLEERDIEKEQENATEELEKMNEQEKSNEGDEQQKQEQNKSHSKAKKSQKNAAKKMKKLSESMQGAMMSGGGEQMQEDVDMLRQILDNLVLFSFDQEHVMNAFKSMDVDHNKFASYLKKQNNLREHFEHIDDSLFALSLRQPKLSEKVNEEISEVYFNIDKAMASLSESLLYQGVSNQQFAITSANNLADFLSDVLDNMQENMNMSPGQGSGGDMQLPDIIKSQEELNEKMKDGMQKSGQGKPNQGKSGASGKDGEQEKEGDKGNQKGDGKGEKQGKNGNSSGGEGEGSQEDLNGMLYQIYMQQQQLREALEKRLNKEGKGGSGDAKRLLREMENIEMNLLNGGFTNATLRRMMALKHQLLRLENAAFEQGEDNKRKSNTNTKIFDNTSNNQIPKAKQYFNTTEILNRQALPLQQIYRKKVQEYFKAE